MPCLQVKFQKKPNSNKFLLELDADQLESLAANLGFFNPDFLESVERAEADFRNGNITKIKSLRELR